MGFCVAKAMVIVHVPSYDNDAIELVRKFCERAIRQFKVPPKQVQWFTHTLQIVSIPTPMVADVMKHGPRSSVAR